MAITLLNVLPKLNALTQSQLATWAIRARAQAAVGQLPDYIPQLAKAELTWMAVQVQRVDGQTYMVGNVQQAFVLMSVVKPFLLLFLLETIGKEAVFAKVGNRPSDQPFHSIPQLIADRCFPRNPMINSGAITLAAMLPGKEGRERCNQLRHWINQKAGSNFELDEVMLASVRSLGNEANRTIAELLVRAEQIDDIETTLDTYNQICCLSGQVSDLARLGIMLAKPHPTISPVSQRIVNALMLTCGLYEASGEFALRIGLPVKSGVSGAILAVVPGEGAIACYSPALDAAGNSIAGLSLLEQIAQNLNLSIFS
jgi:glutaminase